MRTIATTDSRTHPQVFSSNDHHPQPTSVPFQDTSTSLPPGTDYTLIVPLPHDGFQQGTIFMTGPRGISVSSHWRECAAIQVTTDISQASGSSNYHPAFKTTYNAIYSKMVGDSYLTHKIFDSATASHQMYIALKDAVISGAELRLTFHNFFGGSATLWVKGQAILE